MEMFAKTKAYTMVNDFHIDNLESAGCWATLEKLHIQ